MKKTTAIGSAAIFLLIAGFALHCIIGSAMIEQNFSTVAANIASESNLILKDIRYERSLTGAIAYTSFMRYGQADESQFELRHEISTLPVHTKADGSKGLAAAYIRSTLNSNSISFDDREQIKTIFKNQPPLVLETLIDFSGDYHLKLTISPAHIQDKTKTLQFSGLTGHFSVNNIGTQIRGSAKFESLRLIFDKVSVRLLEFKADVDQQKTRIGIWTGKTNATIAHAMLNTPIGAFNINQTILKTEVDERPQGLDYLANFAVRQIISPIGLPFSIDHIDYRIQIDQIDSSATATLSEAFRDFQNAIKPNGSVTNEGSADRFVSMNSGAIDRLMRKGARMTQKLFVGMPAGTLDLDLEMNISGFPITQTIANIDTAAQLMPYLQGRLHAKVPLALLQITPLAPLIETYRQQGFINVEGNDAKTLAAFKNNQLTFNNRPVSLPIPSQY